MQPCRMIWVTQCSIQLDTAFQILFGESLEVESRVPALSPLNLQHLLPERYSSLRRLLRITAWTLKAADRFKEKIGRDPSPLKGPLPQLQ